MLLDEVEMSRDDLPRSDGFLSSVVILLGLFKEGAVSVMSFVTLFVQMYPALSYVVPKRSDKLLRELFWVCEDWDKGDDARGFQEELGDLPSRIMALYSAHHEARSSNERMRNVGTVHLEVDSD